MNPVSLYIVPVQGPIDERLVISPLMAAWLPSLSLVVDSPLGPLGQWRLLTNRFHPTQHWPGQPFLEHI